MESFLSQVHTNKDLLLPISVSINLYGCTKCNRCGYNTNHKLYLANTIPNGEYKKNVTG